ncbi:MULTISPECIES: hypothetical protein [Halomonadaceae]|uniref:LBF_2804 family protein n=1 Tax=Halomonadaceae TaxID=28256 RepID=UPI00159AEAB1|nr:MULTISPECIES: hypothetical protein [Halomonas]QJQ95834.1 hypothetical protein HIO72_11500 [Halomonas sp. PA5]
MTEIPDPRPERHYSPEPSVLERWAARYLQRLNPGESLPRRERSDEEIATLQRVKRRIVIWSAVAGVLSGGIIGGIEVFIRQGLLDGMEGMDWREQLPYWAAFTVVAGVVSGIEILFLYWNALRGIARISCIAGVPLQKSPEARLVVRGLSRVALEFPSPRDRIYGIDPFAYMRNWKLTLRALLYRAKVGASSFILRILLRRILGRVALRGLVPLFTAPLYAVWNAVITWRIMREARENAMGPYAVETLITRWSEKRDELGPKCREALLQGTGEALMRNQDAHPNHVLLLARLMALFESPEQSIKVDWSRQRQVIATLEGEERQALLETLTLASLLGGKVRKGKKHFLEEAYSSLGGVLEKAAIDQLRNKMLDGQPLTSRDLASAMHRQKDD